MPDETPLYLWNNQLHRQFASEQLHFWRLAFSSFYDQTRALHDIETALADAGVNSYVIWELFGEIDMLLRVWIPPTIDVSHVKDEIDGVIRSSQGVRIEGFSCDSILYHWMWQASVTLEDASRDLAAVPATALDGTSAIPAGQVDRLVDQNYLYRLDEMDTIKFFMPIRQEHDLHIDVERDLRRRLLQVVAANEEAGRIENAALYEGAGFARYMLTARVQPPKFEVLSTVVMYDINSLGSLGVFNGVRTGTMLSALANPIARRERLVAPAGALVTGSRDAEDMVDVRGMLREGESEVVEVKASAFCDVERLTKSPKGERTESDAVTDGIVKGVAGMLNARGGTLIIGALEQARYSASAAELVGPALDIGDYFVVGVQLDYRAEGDWDGFSRRLSDVLQKRIDPYPMAWLTVKRVVLEDVPLCVIVVRRPDNWYFADVKSGAKGPQFFARIGSRTEPLAGRTMLDYMNSTPRTSGAGEM